MTVAKVCFLEDYDYKPVRAVTVAYQAGMTLTVKKDCAEKAIAAGKAVAVEGSGKAVEDGEGQNSG